MPYRRHDVRRASCQAPAWPVADGARKVSERHSQRRTEVKRGDMEDPRKTASLSRRSYSGFFRVSGAGRVVGLEVFLFLKFW